MGGAMVFVGYYSFCGLQWVTMSYNELQWVTMKLI